MGTVGRPPRSWSEFRLSLPLWGAGLPGVATSLAKRKSAGFESLAFHVFLGWDTAFGPLRSGSQEARMIFDHCGSCHGVFAPGPVSIRCAWQSGRLAQLGERLIYTQEATGSSPVPSTKAQ